MQLRHGRSAACPANKLPVIKHLIFVSRCTLNVRHVFQIKCLGHAPGFKCCLNLGSVSLSDGFMMIMCRHKRKDQLIKVLLIDEWSKAHLGNCCINSRSVSTTAQTPGHNSSLDIAAASSLPREKLLEPVIELHTPHRRADCHRPPCRCPSQRFLQHRGKRSGGETWTSRIKV